MLPPFTLEQSLEKIVREEWGRILASLVKTLGDIQLAEDCLHDAVISAIKHWQKNGLPASPSAWLITTARRKAIDRLRKDKNFASKKDEIAYLLDLDNRSDEGDENAIIPDDRLEMIFTCCHPALEEKTRIALTLRTLGGLSTTEIASAFLDTPDAMQKRLTRAKKKIALTRIPYTIPDRDVLPERIFSVLRVLYLIFNEGYSAAGGESLTRTNLSDEAIRLARIVYQLLPAVTEAAGLLALLLLHDSRRLARADEDGEMIALEDQNRARWDKTKIAEGTSILEEVLPKARIGPYQLQAAISAVHAQSASWALTDWPQIATLYGLLYRIEPSPVVRINQAMAVSYASSPEDGLTLLDETAAVRKLANYQPYFVARADLQTRIGKVSDAKRNLNTAIGLTENKREKSFLIKKLHRL